VANGRKKGNNSKAPRDGTYRHPEAESPLRPEVGTQAQFRKRIVLMLQEGEGSVKRNL
jgi:hypothetical protein